MEKKFYGVGVGPGDPDLLTVKAANLIKDADIIICPEKKDGSGSFAFDIAEKYIDKEKVKYMTFPMNYNLDELAKKWKENAKEIAELVKSGKSVVFLTLGDPTVYSTYMYVVMYLKGEGIEIETIPGITSFCLAAASQNIPIALGEENFAVIALRKGNNKALRNAMENFENIVVMKPASNVDGLVEVLKEYKMENNFVLITKAGTEEEKVIKDVDDLKDIPYLSLMIIKRNYEK